METPSNETGGWAKRGGTWWDLRGSIPKEMLEEINGQDLGKVAEKNKTCKCHRELDGWWVSIQNQLNDLFTLRTFKDNYYASLEVAGHMLQLLGQGMRIQVYHLAVSPSLQRVQSRQERVFSCFNAWYTEVFTQGGEGQGTAMEERTSQAPEMILQRRVVYGCFFLTSPLFVLALSLLFSSPSHMFSWG